jgi:hypothetical protein
VGLGANGATGAWAARLGPAARDEEEGQDNRNDGDVACPSGSGFPADLLGQVVVARQEARMVRVGFFAGGRRRCRRSRTRSDLASGSRR